MHFERPRANEAAASAPKQRQLFSAANGAPSIGPYFGWPMRMLLPNGSRRPQSVP